MEREEVVYLDHAATAPLDARARAVMLPLLEEDPRLPAGLLADGRRARRIVEEARSVVARALGAASSEIVFTASGTEACNLAIKGAALARGRPGDRILATATEHTAVLYPTRTLGKLGFQPLEIPVDGQGLARLDALEDLLGDGTLLVSIASACGETGVLQPLAEVAALARARGALLHVDACLHAAPGRIQVPGLGADLVSFSAHKLGGPRGVGALWSRAGVRLSPLVEGGVAEGGRRGGAPYVAGIAGFACAAALAAQEAGERERTFAELGARLLAGLLAVSGVALNGHPERRLPGIVNVSVEGVEGEALLLGLARRAVAASSGSSCVQEAGKSSHVLRAMGLAEARARGSVLFSLGPSTTGGEIDRALAAFADVVPSLRALSPAGRP